MMDFFRFVFRGRSHPKVFLSAAFNYGKQGSLVCVIEVELLHNLKLSSHGRIVKLLQEFQAAHKAGKRLL